MQIDPTNPRNALGKFAGMGVTVALVGFVLLVAWRQGVPLVNNVVSNVTGGRVDTSGSAPEVF